MKNILVILILLTGLATASCASSKGVVGKMNGTGEVDPKKCFIDGSEFTLKNKYDDMKITLGFKDGRIFGFSGVNRYMGGYTASNGKVEFGQMGSTMMAGPEKNMNAETDYLKMLQQSKTFECSDKILKIGELVFERN